MSYFFFFFSSRRRHTRFDCDWSSDVCSSDLHPNLYRRVISYSGTFVALQRNATAPNGAWDYHQTLIPGSELKPLRIWLHVSENDNGANAPVEQMRNWVVANNRMADALKAKGYPYQYVFS